MKYKIIASIIILIILGSTYVILSTSNGDIEPLGRLSFVKISNPDMYSGSPHSNLLAQYAEERGIEYGISCTFSGPYKRLSLLYEW